MKIAITSSFILGQGRHAAAGDVLDLPDKEAQRWIRLGNAKPYVPPPAKKAEPPKAPPAASETGIDTQPVNITHNDPSPAAPPAPPPVEGSGRRRG